MKKLSKIIIVCMLIMITLSTILFLNKKEVIYKEEKQKENNLISFMIENEEGKYVKAEENTWLDSEYFILNQELSGCENGGTLSWNEEKQKVEASLISSDKCYAYFTFNKEKYVRDLSGNNNHGKLNNIVSWNEEGLTTSDENKVGYVDCGLAGYDFHNTFSAIVRVRWNSINPNYGWSAFMGNIGTIPNRRGFVFTINNIDKQPYADIYSEGQTTVYPGKEILLNQWYIVIATYDGYTFSVYVDNQSNKLENITNGLSSSELPIFLGGYPIVVNNEIVILEGDHSYTTFSDLLIFDRALTAEEIAQDYSNKINPTNRQGLLLYYKFV